MKKAVIYTRTAMHGIANNRKQENIRRQFADKEFIPVNSRVFTAPPFLFFL